MIVFADASIDKQIEFRNKLRVSLAVFRDLEVRLKDKLEHVHRRPDTFTLRDRIAIPLWALGHVGEAVDVADKFGIGDSTVDYLIDDFCEAVVDEYLTETIKLPDTEQECNEIAQAIYADRGNTDLYFRLLLYI